MDLANAAVARQLLWGIAGAVSLTTLLIGLWLASWRLALLSLIPNLLPLLFVAGLRPCLERNFCGESPLWEPGRRRFPSR